MTRQGAPDTVSTVNGLRQRDMSSPSDSVGLMAEPQCRGRPEGHPTQTEGRVKGGFTEEQLGHSEGTELEAQRPQE